MLLVITFSNDEFMDVVTSKVDQEVLRIDFDRSTTEELVHEWDGVRFRHTWNGCELNKVTAIWYRIAWVSYHPKLHKNPYALFNRLQREESIRYLYGLLEQAHWVSHPLAIARAENKMLQLQTAVQAGMAIPRTLVTGNQAAVVKFKKEVGALVVKPLAKDMVWKNDTPMAFFTTKIEPSTHIDLTMLPESPAIFQEEVKRGYELRITVVGRDIFAAKVERIDDRAGMVDWRPGGLEGLKIDTYELPPDVRKQCEKLVRNLGLEFGCIDMIRDDAGKYVFLEVNANGAWYFIEKATGMPISTSIAKLLANPNSGG